VSGFALVIATALALIAVVLCFLRQWRGFGAGMLVTALIPVYLFLWLRLELAQMAT
jgi:hypothetical protein